jgi:hypothetical protein
LNSLACDVCTTTWLNNAYGTFGGFVASTFNAQQAIPGISGSSVTSTLGTDVELGVAKTLVPWGFRAGGDALAMASSGPGAFWAGSLLETTGILASEVLAFVGAVTTPFASTALI